MKLFRSKQDSCLDQAIGELRRDQPDAKTVTASAERVWQRLQAGEGEKVASSALLPIRGCADIRALLPAFHKRELPPARALIVEDHLLECLSCRDYDGGRRVDPGTSVKWRMEPVARGFQWSFARRSFAAVAVVLLVALAWTGRHGYLADLPGNRARIESIEGQAYRVGPAGERALQLGDGIGEDEFIRTSANSRAKVRLIDGSEVEMNERAELAVSANRRNTTIHLGQGSIIVRAAKRHTGHLYVSAPDCTVAVTGTLFSVNSGTKGSRVAVIEGEVRVKHAGLESILHSGDELATTRSVGLVPVREEIGWSDDLDHELALLAEFSQLRAKLAEIPTPALRYESKILTLLPADTALYISIPNLGDALQQANQIFQQQLSQSEVLQDWWKQSGKANQHPTPDELIEKIRTLSQYLGDEVVITVGSPAGYGHGPVLLAEVRRPGLKGFLQSRLADSLANPLSTSAVHVVDVQSLSALAGGERGMIMLVRPNMLVVGGDAASVRQMSAQLDAGATLFAGTDFGQRIANVYKQGAGILFAVNFGQILGAVGPGNDRSALHGDTKAFQNSGFNDIQYLVATYGAAPGPGNNRIAVEFRGPRHGMASWLAAPAPMGSLDYVSANASAAVSFVAKQPALMWDDLFSTIGVSDPHFTQSLAQTSSELGLDIRNDLASALGGEMTLALDGPILPTPSWKAIAEVNHSGALQVAIEKLVQGLDRQAEKSHQPGLTLTQDQLGGRTFYAIFSHRAGLLTEYHYTFADGYMIMAPSRALLLAALETHANGTSLARSASFRAILPSDNQTNFSAMIYQNLDPILKPLASQFNAGQLALLQQLAAGAKPSVLCAYGGSDRIDVASSGKLLDLNPGIPALIHLLGLPAPGPSAKPSPQ